MFFKILNATLFQIVLTRKQGAAKSQANSVKYILRNQSRFTSITQRTCELI